MKSLIRVFALSAVLVVGIPAVSALWFGEPTYIFSELLSGTVSAQALKVEGPSTATTKPQDTNVCDLKNDPAKYNHAVVKVSGYFSRGFENSSLYDPSCNSNQSIWVELGGRRSVNVIYCCGVAAKSTRKKVVWPIWPGTMRSKPFVNCATFIHFFHLIVDPVPKKNSLLANKTCRKTMQ